MTEELNKVITGLEVCIGRVSCKSCGFNKMDDCRDVLMRHALELLKGQEETLVKRIDLKPCPFCGAEPLKSFLFEGEYFNCTIKCSECYVSVCSVNKIDKRSKNNPAYILDMTEREAESKWNRRHG